MKDTRWSAKKPVVLGLLSLVILLGGFGAWATMTQIAGAIIAPGRIEVDQNRQVVQHPTGGVVTEIAVTEGDSVNAGDVLIQLDVQQMQTRLAIVESQLFELMARRGRLAAERDGMAAPTFDPDLLDHAQTRPDVAELVNGQRNLFLARTETVKRQIDQLERRVEQTRN
ncbi:MAG: biotin/lipoyl-binding protein, partial [Pseudomonadota bacterium]